MAVTVPVRSNADILRAQCEAQRVAGDVGFDQRGIAECGIVATELATNLVHHHAADGEIAISSLDGVSMDGVEIVSADRGPGIEDTDLATQDRYSTAGSSGCGLGAVKRLMDDYEIFSRTSCAGNHPSAARGASTGVGTLITARKWLRRPAEKRPFEYGACSKPCDGETENGDAFLVCEDGDHLTIAVADGLGHGPEAAVASRRAIAHVRESADRRLDQIMRELDARLRQTRGAVVALVRISLADRMLAHASVGNVEARLFFTGRSSLVATRGVLGRGLLAHVKVSETPWPECGGMLIVTTDGVSSMGAQIGACELTAGRASTVAHYLVHNFRRQNDDATAVVVRERVP